MNILDKTISINIYYTTCSETGDTIHDTQLMLEEYFDKINELINKTK